MTDAPLPDDWLTALEDARQEREALHPHQPLLDPRGDQLSFGPIEMTPARRAVIEELRERSRFALTAEEREVGRQRVAELRAMLDRVRDERHGVAS